MTELRPAFVVTLLVVVGLALHLGGWGAVTAPTLGAFLLLVWPGLGAGRSRWPLAAALALAAATAGWGLLAGGEADFAPDALAAEYDAFWQRLEAPLAVVPELEEALAEEPEGGAGERRSRLFEILGRWLERPNDEAVSLLLYDSGGEAVAWAGDGLLHEPELTPPRVGRSFRLGQTAVTLTSTVSVPMGDRRPWRLLAGLSRPTDVLPFGAGSRVGRWWLQAAAEAESESAPPTASPEPTAGEDPDPEARAFATTAVAIPRPDAPTLWIEPAAAEGSAGSGEWWRRLAALLVGGSSLLVAILLLGDRFAGDRGSTAWIALATVSGVLVAGWDLLSRPALFGLALAVGCVVAALALPGGRRSPAAAGMAPLAGGLLVVGVGAAVLLFQRTWPVPELSLAFGGGAEIAALRLMVCLSVLAGALAIARWRPSAPSRDLVAWLATVTLLAAAAVHDLAWLAAPLLVAGGAMAVRWLAGTTIERRPGVWGVALIFAALVGATAWETAHRVVLRETLHDFYLPRLAPPTGDEINDILLELDASFRSLDLGPRVAGDEPEIDYHDLAFVLWRDSPLAHRDGLSSLVVEPLQGEDSSFAFGLGLDADLELILDPSRWRVPAVPEWQRSLIFGETPLTAHGEPWGTARYSFLPRPGFRLEVSEVDELESSLVRGVPHRRVADGLPRGVLFGIYDEEGKAYVSPWQEEPPLPNPELPFDEGPKRWQVFETPDGPSWTLIEAGDEGLEVIFLLQLQPSAALERVGVHALGSLLPIALVAVLWAVAPPQLAFRDWLRQVLRSYSRRLILVYTVLLLLPLIALNLVLLRGFEQRLHDQQLANAHAAVASARFFLLDYLRGLELGFGIDTQVNRTLLEWISTVVQHQVNLYWGSQVYASSQQELFTAGLLPRRIPGEIFDRLAHHGYEIGIRTQQHEDASYLELYAPLDVPGIGLSQQGLFLSVPLLEQEEGVLRELAALRRRAFLATSALFLLLLAVGSRLVASFTQPLMELIEGTGRIAAGAPALGLQPKEEELSALVTAIDVMAGRIDEGRRRLMEEKQLVDRIVESITSAVVSLDRDGAVRLQNRVAEDLLGTTVGERLSTALARQPRFASLDDFVAEGGALQRQATLRFEDGEGEERDWTLIWVPLPGEGDREALLVVDDATEVLRAQRLEAWAEMARIIAHEIKNPLTPIRLSTEHMQQVYRADPGGFGVVFERCTDNILRQVEELRDLASDFSIYSQIPQAELVGGDMADALEGVVNAYEDSARAAGVTIEWQPHPGVDPPRFDRKLLSRAVRNLLENALRASPEGGVVEVVLAPAGDESVVIQVRDQGPGVDPQNLPRIFEPYFSTHDSGTGLGLAITRRIVQEHGGRIEAQNQADGGLLVEITLPRGERGATLEIASQPVESSPEDRETDAPGALDGDSGGDRSGG